MTRQSSAIVPCPWRRRAAILPLSLVLTGCQGDPPRRADMAAVFDTTPSPPGPPRDPGRLVPMTPADIRRSAMTCLQPPPYPADGGPQCLRPDGTWIAYSGWGNTGGRYTIAGNEVRIEPPAIYRDLGGTTDRIAFFRSADDRIFLRYLGPPEAPRIPLDRYDEADYLNGR